MPTGYIPRGDGAFDAWQTNSVAYVWKHYGELGLPSDVPTRLKVAQRAGPSSTPVLGPTPYGEHTAARQAAAHESGTASAT